MPASENLKKAVLYAKAECGLKPQFQAMKDEEISLSKDILMLPPLHITTPLMVKPCAETMRDVTNSAVRTVGEGLGFDEFVKEAMNQDSFPSLNLTNSNMLK